MRFLLDPNTFDGRSKGVNNHGDIVGVLGGPAEAPFLLRDGDLIELKFLQGGDVGGVEAINDHGQMVGWAENRDFEQRAVLWEGSRIVDLGTLGGEVNQAMDINNRGQIVGHALVPDQDGEEERHAFLWENGKMFDLNELMPANDDWILEEANAINDQGQIAGRGLYRGVDRAFLLSLD